MTVTGIRTTWNRRALLRTGLQGLALASLPGCLLPAPRRALASDAATDDLVADSVVRPATLFAGIRRPITSRAELEPRIEILEKACRGRTAGPLTHIIRFDTPVEGFDSEIGFPVGEPVATDEITTHTLREMHFYAAVHQGPQETARETAAELYRRLDLAGLSPELEYVEVFLNRDAAHPARSKTRVMASYLAWPEVYRAQLERVLGATAARAVWRGGERVTPFTPVDERCSWVAATIDRLKARTTAEQQFDVLSRVALVRPPEDILQYQEIYDREHEVEAVLRAQNERLSTTRTGGFVDPPTFDGKILHLSKVPSNREAYLAATTATERRKAYCFCALVREASEPRIDPIFCYRAAGWARQLWEPVLRTRFTRCVITHSVLKGDPFCAWDFHLA
jgi:hypothetical protein